MAYIRVIDIRKENTMTITTDVYAKFQAAYDHFNKVIWKGKLPSDVLLTIVQHKTAYGYFRHDAVKVNKKGPGSKEPAIVHEIALNPLHFNRPIEEVLSTLVHEQAHLWQAEFGNPGKSHHNKEWADKMEEVGLMPSSTGQEGGKRTGRKVSHYIIPGGAFDKAMKKCKIKFNLTGIAVEQVKKGSNRTKYTCPECGLNAYGKPELNITCGECEQQLEEQ